MSKQRDDLALVGASSAHNVAYADLLALLDKHAGQLTTIEILAVASNLVGRLVALQSVREFTFQQVMVIISQNIEEGNRQICDELRGASATKH